MTLQVIVGIIGTVALGLCVWVICQAPRFARWLRTRYALLRIRYGAGRREAERVAAYIECLTPEEIEEILAGTEWGQP